MKYIDDSSVYVNWSIDDYGDSPVKQIEFEWRTQDGKTELAQKDANIDHNNFNGTTVSISIPNGAEVKIRLRNMYGVSELSDSFSYTAPGKKQFESAIFK